MAHTTLTAPSPTVASQLRGWDHLEWWVGNARAFAAWLASGFGFDVVAYAGPETGVADRVSYLLAQGEVRFVITAGLGADSEVSRHVLRHGDGVRHLAWRVDDPDETATLAAARGAIVVTEPTSIHRDSGSVTTAAIATYGDTRHLFIARAGGPEFWGPDFTADRLPPRPPGHPVGLAGIDHVVGNVEKGRLDDWVSWYGEVLGFSEMRHFDAAQISTQYSALRSTVVHNGAGIVMPINEPAPGLKQSQIEEYLQAYGGPGVQHIALATPDIVTAVTAMRSRGARFLQMPPEYYEDARVRVANPELPWSDLQRLDIEVDADSGGHLLQIFTETLADRPTVFFEIIQRLGATGFGEGNFKALFEAIEREQARRGNL
jgi:4-hydroxyphenylpyruvate dioxygenase